MNAETFINGLYLYLAVINVITFCIYGIDKAKAKLNAWRIAEKVLIGLAVAGGSLGAWLGMKAFRHKTKHTLFKLLIPTLVIVHIVLLFVIVRG